MLRSVAAVLAGLLVAVVMVLALSSVAALLVDQPRSGPPTPAYLALDLLVSALSGAAGGAVAVWIAPHAPHGHVLAVAAAVLLLSLPGLFSAPAPGQPGWYAATLSVVAPAAVVIGGRLALRSRRVPLPAPR